MLPLFKTADILQNYFISKSYGFNTYPFVVGPGSQEDPGIDCRYMSQVLSTVEVLFTLMAPGLPKIPTGEKSGAVSSLIGDEKWTFFIRHSLLFLEQQRSNYNVFSRRDSVFFQQKREKYVTMFLFTSWLWNTLIDDVCARPGTCTLSRFTGPKITQTWWIERCTEPGKAKGKLIFQKLFSFQ